MSKAALDRTLAAWAKEFRETLPLEILRYISQAGMDLHFGCPEDDFPGFETACLAIKSALEDVPSTLYVDTDSETWSEREPAFERCDSCEGTGSDENHSSCADCNGLGGFEPYTEGTYEVDRVALKRALVGKDLAEYV